MTKLRKMLSDLDAPYIQSLMRLMETQSRETIAAWCTGYAQAHLLPLWEGYFPADGRPRAALSAAQGYLAGKVKLAEAKKQIAACRSAARESEGLPVAQGAARTADAAASSIHNPAAALGLALYGALTLAYSTAGTDAPWETLEALAADECGKMEAALRSAAVEGETNPAKLQWNC